MDRLKVFEVELNYIKNPKIRKFTEEVLKEVPEYFWTIPASSTGKYHSPICRDKCGLIKHTKMCIRFAVEIMNLEMMKFTNHEKDIIISSLILHDSTKHGLNHNKYSDAKHPLIIVKFIKKNDNLNSILDNKTLSIILGCLRSHMGEFNKDYKTKKEILPKPNNRIERMVHLCDILGSRPFIKDFDFNIKVNRK